ncbi:hypothetical protein [uncultured Shewanella sp.]|uniref:hypothetical protein n=1 Tax=uncultured Shewanella sp. TaxID=173975 RepID=UPI002616F922|nr:hypothetical protein [uncultured Shewanella sp.]
MKKSLCKLIPTAFLLLFSQIATAFEEPVIASSAHQPIEAFNKLLADAQLQQRQWSLHPQDISTAYTENEFVLLKIKQTEEKVISYNVHQDKDQNQTLLLILTLSQKGSFWVLDEAQLTWQCQNRNDVHFSTKPCSLSPN